MIIDAKGFRKLIPQGRDRSCLVNKDKCYSPARAWASAKKDKSLALPLWIKKKFAELEKQARIAAQERADQMEETKALVADSIAWRKNCQERERKGQSLDGCCNVLGLECDD